MKMDLSIGLRGKTALVLGGLLLVLFAVLYLGSSRIILGEFVHLELETARKDVDRTLLALDERRATLEATAMDWAFWDETYAFAQTRDPAFIAGNLVPDALTRFALM